MTVKVTDKMKWRTSKQMLFYKTDFPKEVELDMKGVKPGVNREI